MRRVTIISGGQTGADRAALDFALEAGLEHGGWCPRGRRAEDGPLAACYCLQETPDERYDQRTRWNVRDSDATLVFGRAAELTGGTALTRAIAVRVGKPVLLIAQEMFPSVIEAAETVVSFLREHRVGRLNVAGPRASQEPEIGRYVRAVLAAALHADVDDSASPVSRPGQADRAM